MDIVSDLLLQASHESRARSSAFASAAAMTLDEEETMETTAKEQEQQQQESSSAATLERRYGSLRPAAVGLLAKRNSRKCFDSADYALERHAAASSSSGSLDSAGAVSNIFVSAASSATPLPSCSRSASSPLLLKQQQQQPTPLPRISNNNSNNNNNGVLPFAASTSPFGRMASSTLA